MPVPLNLLPKPRAAGVTVRGQRAAARLGLALAAAAETLAEAIAHAYRNNPELQVQRAELRALDEAVIEALSPCRLGATINGNVSYNERQQRGVSSDNFTVFEQRNMGVSMIFTQLLTSGGRTAAQVPAAEAKVLGERERLREIENAILFEAVDAYALARRDQQLVAIQAQAVENYERQVAQDRSRESEGDLAMTDVAQAEAQLLIIRAALAHARASLALSRSRFAAVIGRDPATLDAEPPLPSVPPTAPEAQRAALEESPTLCQAILAENGSCDRIAAARAERHPTVAAQANAGYVNPQGFRTRDLGGNVGGGLTFPVPCITQGIVDSRIRSALAIQQSGAFRVEDTRHTVAAGILNAWNQTVTAQEQLRVGSEAVTAAESALVGVRCGFAEGFRSNFEVIDSEQRLPNAQVLVVNARCSLFAGQATMLAFIGRLQAVAMIDGVEAYDPAANPEMRRKDQFGPFVPVVRAYDSLAVAGRSGLPVAPIAPVAPRRRHRTARSPPACRPIRAKRLHFQEPFHKGSK